MVMGFIIFGVTTPSEAAATGAIGAFIVAALYRRLTFKVLKDSLYGTLYIGGMIFLIITGAVALGQLLALTGATRDFLDFIVELGLSAILLVIVQLAVLVLGLFIDQLSIMLVAIPVLVPILGPLGIDPLWLLYWGDHTAVRHDALRSEGGGSAGLDD